MSFVQVFDKLGNLNKVISDEGVKEVLFDKFASNGNVSAVIVSREAIMEELWAYIRSFATDLTKASVIDTPDDLSVHAAMISQYSTAISEVDVSDFAMFIIPSDEKF